LNANLIDIVLNDSSKAVTALTVSSYSGKPISVRAKRYVLCLGGIENARMLLNANKQVDSGIGNEHDLVGRFFMEHPTNGVADFLVNHENPYVQSLIPSLVKKDILLRSFYAPSRKFMAENKLANFCIRIVPNSTQFKYDSLTFTQKLKKVICTSDTAHSLAKLLEDKLWCYDGEVRVSWEQSPNPSSRIKLGKNVDRFGNRRVEIDWQLTPIDKSTVQQATIMAGKIFATKDIGRVRVRDWVFDSAKIIPTTEEDEVGGNHHMGTTRMADSQQNGVVNKNLQIFGVENLYIGGSSVFTTSGYSNPTLTIVQLSLRLAEYLNNELDAA
jgi:choline dehydrogenase-like flavoprotein